MELRLAKLNNFDDYYKLKADDSNVYWTGWSNKPDYENLKKFYIEIINNLKTIKDRRIYLAYEEDKCIGYIYIDYVDEETFALSPAISSEVQGKGYGKELIGLGIKEGLNLGFKKMEAYIREDNIASIKCFESNGTHKTDVKIEKRVNNLNSNVFLIKYELLLEE